MSLIIPKRETAEDARALFTYDAHTGELRWRARRKDNKVVENVLAGCHESEGYIKVSVFGRKEKAHRLAWIIFHGTWPTGQIDHLNGIKDDNRIANLRDCSASDNQLNRHKCRKDNAAGVRGVTKRGRRFRANICIRKTKMALGSFSTLAEAKEARQRAEIAHGLQPCSKESRA